MGSRTGLAARDLRLAYADGDRQVLAVDQVSLDIPVRGFFGVMGPSGSGKSSLLYLLSGLKRATAGEASYAGRSYAAMGERELTQVRRERFGFVFQQPFLLQYLTARENVLAAAPMGDGSALERVDSLLERLGVLHLSHRYPHHLSGGERQRVCVARAMVNEPEVIFADEPTASLDHTNGHVVVDLLADYRDRGAVLMVTHDPEMLAGADMVVRMRDGRVEAEDD